MRRVARHPGATYGSIRGRTSDGAHRVSDCGTSVDWTKQQAMDHVVLVLFENRSFDNLLGHLYTEQEKPGFEGVLGKTLSNPVPEWEGLERVPAGEPGSEENRVRYGPVDADNVNVPNPDPGEEYPHTNTQIYNVLRPENRFEGAHKMMLDPNVPGPGDEHDIEIMGGSSPTTSATSSRCGESCPPTPSTSRSCAA